MGERNSSAKFSMTIRPGLIIYICGAVGVPDVDRCNALAAAGSEVFAWEVDRKTEYLWDKSIERQFNLIKSTQKLQAFETLLSASTVIVYGYNKPIAFIFACIARILNKNVISLNDSKFDDYERNIISDLLKFLLILPYRTILSASYRSTQYIKYLGKRSVFEYYCAINTSRVSDLANSQDLVEFRDRSFLVVARFVEKKNYDVILDAYIQYAAAGGMRRLTICGYGEREGEIRAKVAESELLSSRVTIVANATTADVATALSGALALLLPSKEEQFGIVITEAQACGVPVIASMQCGGCDIFENWQGGFKVEPGNAYGISRYMLILDQDEQLWRGQARVAAINAQKADVSVFVGHVSA